MLKNIPLSAMIGLFFTGLYFLAAIFAPLLAPYGMAEVVGDVWEPSSSEHLLGTDNIGRDLLSRMIYGGERRFSSPQLPPFSALQPDQSLDLSRL